VKEFVTIAGLPRSGSTVLANILAQNPSNFVSKTSGVIDLLLAVRQQWDSVPSLAAHQEDDRKVNAMRGVIEGFYSSESNKVVFDRSRAWPQWVEFLKEAFCDVKIIATVRDIREVLASWELLWRKDYLRHDNLSDIDRMQCATVQGRVDYWMRYDQQTGLGLNWLIDAFHRGHSDSILLVDYENLTSSPETEINRIYDFIGQPRFAHSFTDIEQVLVENDVPYGHNNLHDIRSDLAKAGHKWQDVLGEEFEHLKRFNFWSEHGQA